MPKNKVKTVHVNKEVFLYILKKKNSSIRKLGSSEKISFTEKTIRRALNNGEMRPELVKQIAIHLNVESSLLTGEKVKKAFTAKNNVFRDLYLSPLDHIEDFPYFREEQEDLLTVKQDGLFESGGMAETIKRLLSLFDVSYTQFEEFDFDTQYNFEHELFNVMIPIIKKHFKVNAYGQDGPFAFMGIINDLEDYKEQHDMLEYAENVLRPKYIENPPKGLTKTDITKMSSQDILDYDIALQMQENYDPDYKSPLETKYHDYTLIKENDTEDDVRKKLRRMDSSPQRRKK